MGVQTVDAQAASTELVDAQTTDAEPVDAQAADAEPPRPPESPAPGGRSRNGASDSRRFFLVLGVLTALCCAVTAVVNFANMPPFEDTADLAVSALAATSAASAPAGTPAAPLSGASGAAAGAPVSAGGTAPASRGASSAPLSSVLSGSASSSASSKASSARSASSAVSGPVNVNTADAAALASLPGIGDTLAQCIIDYRQQNGPFSTLDDLKNVKGIGDKKAAALAGLVVF